MTKVISLEISSWSGISIAATHYYGKLQWQDENEKFNIGTLDVERTLSEYDALQLNEKDDGFSYERGDKTSRFDSEENLILAAIALAVNKFGTNIVVRLNCYTSAQVERTVYAPTLKIFRELQLIENEWYMIWESCRDAWSVYEDKLDKILSRWNAVNKKYGIQK